MKAVISSSFANFLAALVIIFAFGGAVLWMVIETGNELRLMQATMRDNPWEPPDAGSADPFAVRLYRNDVYGYEFEYPASWTYRDDGNDGTYLVFRERGERDPAKALLTFDLACVFATGFEGEPSVRTETEEIVPGDYVFTDEKTYVMANGGGEQLALRMIEVEFPDWYRAPGIGQCSGPSFIVGGDIDESQLYDILSSFRFLPAKKGGAGGFCGGIAGIPCAKGYICELEGKYPDAGGTCVPENPKPTPPPGPATCAPRGYCRNGESCPAGTACSGPPAYGCYPLGCPTPICLARGTTIETPDGDVAVEDIRVGMAVWTVDAAGKKIAAPVAKVSASRTPASHRVVRLALEDGRTVSASPNHPLADGRLMGSLKVGDSVDGVRVRSAEDVPYSEPYTYDILPAGETGVYWANGVLLRSTLR